MKSRIFFKIKISWIHRVNRKKAIFNVSLKKNLFKKNKSKKKELLQPHIPPPKSKSLDPRLTSPLFRND